MRRRGLSLNAKVALTVAGAFAAILAVFIAALIPYQRNERQRSLEREERLVEILREKYARDLVYDLLSQNRESLVVDLADLARQPGIVWVAVEAKQMSVSGTTDPAMIARLLGAASPSADAGHPALMLGEGGAALVGEGGRAVRVEEPVAGDRMPQVQTATQPGQPFREVDWLDGKALHYQANLQAADDVFGRLHIVASLAEVRRAEARTRGIASGLAGATFVVSLLLLNLLLSRLVVQPVHGVAQAMSRAQAGDLSVRLEVTSHDEVGMMGAAFNEMVAQLGDSKRATFDYSHGLERKVEERTHELRASEERLRNLSQYLETVIEHAATGVVSTDDAGRIATFNRRAIEILGKSDADVVGKTLDEALAGHATGSLLGVVAEARESGAVSRAQLELRLPEGRRTVAVVASTLRDAASRRLGTVLVLDDLTQVIASQRLSAWKEAVERVIHEIKNPLTPIGLTTEMLRRAFVEDRARFDEMFPSASERIVSSVRALKTLISEFTQFYRMPRMLLKPLDVNALVSEVVAPWVQAGPGGVAVRCTLAQGVPAVAADSEQLKRVLLNVVNNGIEAMAVKPGTLGVSTAVEGAEVVIGVRDEGTGVEDVERLFEPYYTTKAKGTGLGLVISKQIVEQHGGTLRISSELGVGTDVRIRLPAML